MARLTVVDSVPIGEALARCGVGVRNTSEGMGEQNFADFRRAIHVLAVWRPVGEDLRGGPIESGHHVAEEAPEELAAVIGDFLRA